MATIRSLVCWGGKSGFTATMTIASPCVVTISNHGIRQYNGGTTPMTKGIVFSTTGELPTGVVAWTAYWARRIDDNTFHLYDTEAHALDTGSTTGRINTSGTQSGTHTAKGAYYLSLSTSDKAPYTYSSVEYIFNGISQWTSSRIAAGVLRTNVEQCEIAEAFTEYTTSSLAMVNMITAYNLITTKINGVRTSAFHTGVIDKGYVFKTNVSYDNYVNLNRINTEIDGVQFYSVGAYGYILAVNAPKQKVKNCIVRSINSEYGNIGIRVNNFANTVENNIVINNGTGILGLDYSGAGTEIFSNLVAKCGTGIQSQGEFHEAFYHDNISIGNTTDWTGTLTRIPAAICNAGPSGSSPWSIPAGSDVTVETSDFVDFANNDFRPRYSTSPQVATGFNVYGGEESDIVGRVRPSWYEDNGSWVLHNNWSIGPYEYNFGDPPTMADVTIQNVQDGSRWMLYNVTDDVAIESGTQSGTSDIVVSDVVFNGSNKTFKLVVRKSSAAPYYKPFETNAMFTGNNLSIYVSQELDTVAGS